MAGPIHFGRIITTGDKTVMNDASGIGIDTEAVIKAQLAPKEAQLKKTKDDIELNVKKLAAFSELRTKLSSLKEINNKLKFDSTVNPLVKSVFNAKTSIIRSDDGLAKNYIEVVPNNKCPIGEYSFSITNLATVYKAISDSFPSKTASATGIGAGYFGVGTFSINNIPITINNNDNLINIVSKINSVQNDSHTQAYIMQITSSDYRLVLQSTQTGLANSFTVNDPAGILNNIVLNDTPASDAEVIFNNITITSPANIIKDTIDGLTLNLLNPTPINVTINCLIETNTLEILQTLVDLQQSYNEFIEFFLKQTAKKTDDLASYKDDAFLAKENLLHAIQNHIRNLIMSPIQTSNQASYPNLSSIGITVLSSNFDSIINKEDLKVINDMQIDFAKLSPILASNFEEVKSLFATQFHSTDANFGLLATSNNIKINNFSLDVDTSRIDSSTDGKVRITYTNNGSTTTIFPPYKALTNRTNGHNDLEITGPQRSAIEGVKLLFRDNGSGLGQSDITLTQGISDKISNYLTNILNTTNGILKITEDRLTSNTKTQRDKASSQEANITREREQQLSKYATMQSKVAAYNRQIETIKAWTDSQHNNK